MADNYLGNKMDDYRSGRLRPSAASSSRRKPKGLNVPIAAERTIWIRRGAWLPAGEAVVAAMCRAGMSVAYSHERSREGARLAETYGARHVPEDVDAPGHGHFVDIAFESIIIDGIRVSICFDPDDPDQIERAATTATFFVTPTGRYASAEIELKHNPDL